MCMIFGQKWSLRSKCKKKHAQKTVKNSQRRTKMVFKKSVNPVNNGQQRLTTVNTVKNGPKWLKTFFKKLKTKTVKNGLQKN